MLELIDKETFAFNVKFNVTIGPLEQSGVFNATTSDIEEAKTKFREYLNREMKVMNLEIVDFTPVIVAPTTDAVN